MGLRWTAMENLKLTCWTFREKDVVAFSSHAFHTIHQSKFFFLEHYTCIGNWFMRTCIDSNFSHFYTHSDSEGELTLSAGDYLLVWGSGEPQSGYFDAELLDGRRGLVPASYVTRLIGKWMSEKYTKKKYWFQLMAVCCLFRRWFTWIPSSGCFDASWCWRRSNSARSSSTTAKYTANESINDTHIGRYGTTQWDSWRSK